MQHPVQIWRHRDLLTKKHHTGVQFITQNSGKNTLCSWIKTCENLSTNFIKKKKKNPCAAHVKISVHLYSHGARKSHTKEYKNKTEKILYTKINWWSRERMNGMNRQILEYYKTIKIYALQGGAMTLVLNEWPSIPPRTSAESLQKTIWISMSKSAHSYILFALPSQSWFRRKWR